MYTRYITVNNDSNFEQRHQADVAFREFEENNCTFPHLQRIIYRTSDENTPNPILTTIVFFADGSKIVVKNSKHDSIALEDKTLSDGSIIKVPTAQSKEVAVLYAIVKRMFSNFDVNGKLKKCIFNKFIKNIDAFSEIENVSEAEAKIDKARAKKAYNEAKANAKPKKRRYSIHETLEKMNEVLDKVIPYVKSTPEQNDKKIPIEAEKPSNRIDVPVTDGSEEEKEKPKNTKSDSVIKTLSDVSDALEKITKIFKD